MSKIVGLWPKQCCALQGNGLPRQCDHWLAMTGKILHSAPKIGALRNENRVIAREQSDRGNPPVRWECNIIYTALARNLAYCNWSFPLL